MKNKNCGLVLVMSVTLVAAAGCREDRISGPEAIAGANASFAVVAAVPSVSSLGGTTNTNSGIADGLAAMDCGRTWNGSRVINDATGAYRWTVNGKNFGAVAGSISIAGIQAKVSSWTDSKIVVDPTVPWNWGAMSTTMVIKTAGGTQTTVGVNIVPAISTRIFGQCTYYVARRRRELGMAPSPTAFGGYSSISASYAPRVGDQYWWTWSGGKHTGIVNGVSVSTARDGTVTYAVTVGEQNIDCKNSTNSFVATFAAKGSAIITKLMHPKLGETTRYYR